VSTQLRKQIDTRCLRETPVEENEIRVDDLVDCIHQRRRIGKTANAEAILEQFIGERFSEIFVILDEKDTDGVGLVDPRDLEGRDGWKSLYRRHGFASPGEIVTLNASHLNASYAFKVAHGRGKRP
jgi:hypothetical protein